MPLTFDLVTYSILLAKAAPKVIETEAEYERALALTEQLHFQKNRTPEERAYKLLVILIEVYEAEHFPIPELPPHEILQQIIEASNTPQADLVGLIGSSSVVSEVVNGKRAISIAQAKALSKQLQVSPNLFI